MRRILVISMAAAVGLFALLACVPHVWSQTSPAPATTQPEQQQTPGERDGRPPFRRHGERRFGDGMRPSRMEWRRGDTRPEHFNQPTEQEWKEIEAFMKSHSPERLQRLDELGDEERQQSVRTMFAARYRAMQELKERDPELYQIRLARMPIEDKVFELSWRLRQQQMEKADETRREIRKNLRLLVKNQLQERALRLAREQQRLREHEQKIEELVEANLRDIAAERLPRALRPQLPLRRDHHDEQHGESDHPDDVDATHAEEP